jgi:hypothetical protein
MRTHEQTVAYLAGFIDGEGCFGVYPGKKTCRTTFSVGGRDEALMRTVQKMFHDLGIDVSWCMRSDRTFMIQTERAKSLLKICELIVPHMAETPKREKAEKIELTLSQPA